MPKLTTESKKEIIQLIKNNYKIQVIAERFGVTKQAITQIKNNYLKYGQASLIIQKVGRKLLADKTPEQLEIIALKEKVKQLELEVDFTKKLETFISNQD